MDRADLLPGRGASAGEKKGAATRQAVWYSVAFIMIHLDVRNDLPKMHSKFQKYQTVFEHRLFDSGISSVKWKPFPFIEHSFHLTRTDVVHIFEVTAKVPSFFMHPVAVVATNDSTDVLDTMAEPLPMI